MKSWLLKTFRFLLAGLFGLAGLSSLSLWLLPYSTLKALGDRLSPDGNYRSFTPAFAAALHLPAAAFGLLLLLIGVGWIVFRSASERLLLEVRRFLADWRADARSFFADLRRLRMSWQETVLLAALFVLGLIPRLLLLNRPIEYDEAYNFTQFVRYPFRVIVSDYNAPNNHVLNTLLMRVVYLLIGDQPWQIRLPAFLAGLLVLLAAFLLGRTLYGKAVGFLAAGLLISLPDFILRSVSARGYPLVVLMALLCFSLAGYLVRHKNRFGWTWMIVFGALGFYAVPVMLYPICVIYLWLLLETFDLDPRQYTRKSWLACVLGAAVLTAALTAVLYSPILLSPNFSNIYQSNSTLHPVSLGDFFAILPERFNSLVTEWQRYLPVGWSIVIGIGLVLSLAWIWKERKFKVPTQAAFVLGLALVLLAQRPGSVTRIWLWIVPLLALWSAAGILTTLAALPSGWVRRVLAWVVPGVIVAGMAVNAIGFARTAQVNQWGEDPVAEEVTLAILPHLTPQTIVAVDGCLDARYWYYFYIHGASLGVFYKPDKPRAFDQEIAIVYSQPKAGCGIEPVADTLRLYGPDPAQLDMNTLKSLDTIYYATIYAVQPRP